MSGLWLWLLSFSYADMLQTPPIDSKKEADKLLSLSKRMLRKERGLSIRRGRFLVPQKGYKYRVVIDGVRNEEKAGELASRLIGVWSGIELVTSSGQNKVYNEGGKSFDITLPTKNTEVVTEEKTEVKTVEPAVELEEADSLSATSRMNI